MCAGYTITCVIILIVLSILGFKFCWGNKRVALLGVIVIFIGTIFTCYDMLPICSKLNNKIFHRCEECNSLIDRISIVFKGAVEEGEKHVIFEKDKNQYKALIKIIRLNKDVSMQNPSKIIIWPSGIGQFTSSGVVRLNNGIENEGICRAEILVKWIRDYRRNGFLKTGLFIIGFGSVFSFIGLVNTSRRC